MSCVLWGWCARYISQGLEPRLTELRIDRMPIRSTFAECTLLRIDRRVGIDQMRLLSDIVIKDQKYLQTMKSLEVLCSVAPV